MSVLTGFDGDPYGWCVGDLVFARRLSFRLSRGFWCPHTSWSPGVLIDLGRVKLSRCLGCGIGSTKR